MTMIRDLTVFGLTVVAVEVAALVYVAAVLT